MVRTGFEQAGEGRAGVAALTPRGVEGLARGAGRGAR